MQSDILVRWGPGLEATVNPSMDGSLRALYVAQWVRPALVPVLEACLEAGDLFVDVGANIGLYATWGAKIVGPTGVVLALEPVPRTRAWLEHLCAQNELSHVRVISTAAGEKEGSAWIQTTDGASGLSRVVLEPQSAIRVPITTLDRLLGSRVPALIKIDVEGHELAVLRGARRTLQGTLVPVVFEAPEFGGGSGTIYCVELLESIGYRVLSLTPWGVRDFHPERYSHNLLAIDAGDGTIEARLQGARFPRSQNT
ncbi:MAG TPA: FkbM family methyltransferase [Acidimicrobiales bacterium]|nr:FkbM family methyltransferase [Acidimicrobiales bacterium]